MSSNVIYESQKVLPYVYLCTHRVTGEFYIGFRRANKLPSHQDFPRYKTSSKQVKPRFDEFDWVVLAEFFNGDDAFAFENKLIEASFSNPLCLNRHYCKDGHKKFHVGPHSDEAKMKMSIYRKTEQHRNGISKAKRGKPLSEGHRLQLSIAKQVKIYTLISPDGIIHNTKQLGSFCKLHNLSHSAIKKYFAAGKQVFIHTTKKYPAMIGWTCLNAEALLTT